MHDAQRGVLEGDPGHGGASVLVFARLGVVTVGEAADQKRVGHSQGLLGQGIGEVVGPTGDVGLDRVTYRVHA